MHTSELSNLLQEIQKNNKFSQENNFEFRRSIAEILHLYIEKLAFKIDYSEENEFYKLAENSIKLVKKFEDLLNDNLS